MKKRKLGTGGPEVSAIGYGAMGFHLAYGAADTQAGLDLIKRAYDKGVTFFDTADSTAGVRTRNSSERQ